MLDQLAGYAINYYEDFVKPTKAFRAPTEQERAAMTALAAKLKALPPGSDAEAIQNEVFEVGKDAGFEPLRAAGSPALYEVCCWPRARVPGSAPSSRSSASSGPWL